MSAIKKDVTIGNCRLILGDCLEVMPLLGKVDHIISDPPYEDELHAAIGRIKRTDGREMIKTLGFSGINAIRGQVAAASVAASNGWVILFTLAEGVMAWRDELQKVGSKYDTCLAWIKPDSAPRFNGQGAARGFECAVTAWCGRGHRHWNSGGKRGVYTHCVNVGRDGRHPTEKPVPLMSEILTDFSQAGQTIMDPFMGSGTLLVACAKTGRRGIGIELDETHFATACCRVEDAYRQADLFIAPPEPKMTQRDLLG